MLSCMLEMQALAFTVLHSICTAAVSTTTAAARRRTSLYAAQPRRCAEDMVAVNWIIKSSERCEHHKGLVDGRLSQESDNTYRERTVVKHWGS